MATPTQQEASTLNSGPPPESSVRDFSAAMDSGVKPIAEHTVDASAAVLAVPQDLGPNPSEEIGLTAEPDSVSYFGQKTQVTQLQALGAVLWRMRRSRNLTLQHETLEIIPHMVDGIVEYMKQQETIQKEMQERINLLEGENVMLQGNLWRLQNNYAGADGFIERLKNENQDLYKKWKDLEKTVIRFEFSNQTLRIENEHLKEELNSMIGIPDRDTESDTEVRGKKRSRSEITVGPTRRDATDSDTESQSEKRARR